MRFRSAIKRITPERLVILRQRWIWAKIRRHYSTLPVAEAFDWIYRSRAWGTSAGEPFCSGFGSDAEFAKPYVNWVRQFIDRQNIREVVDLGCGDFRIGRLICAPGGNFHYVGLDVVAELIAYNRSQFGNNRIEFRLADIIQDELPDGELCLIRQVLQHLSIAEISQVLKHCSKYKYLLVTEEIYSGKGRRPNRDKPHGPDNRLYDRSGVYLDLPPFRLETATVLEIPASKTSIMRTSLVARQA